MRLPSLSLPAAAVVLLLACKETPPSATSASGSSAKTDAAAFSATLKASGPYKVGQQGTLKAVVTAVAPHHVNPEYPFKFALDKAPAGVSYPKPVVTDVKRSEMEATLEVPFTPETKGEVTVSGTCSLSVCTDDACVIEKVPLSAKVTVE